VDLTAEIKISENVLSLFGALYTYLSGQSSTVVDYILLDAALQRQLLL